MSQTKVGYIGVDHHHRDPYLQLSAKLPVEMVALCEPGKEYTAADIRPHTDRPDEIATDGADIGAIAERAEIYADPTELIADADVDVIWVTYRNDEVPGFIDSAIEHGVDVICEKPLARTAADLRPLAERADEADVTVGVNYIYRYTAASQALKERVDGGFFGDIWSVDGRYIGSKLDYRNRSHYIYDDAISRGGSLQWIGIHWIDLFMYVLGEPIASVCARSRTPSDGDIDEGIIVQFETDSGIMGTFQTGYYLGEPEKDTRFAVYGENATADTPLHHNRSRRSTVPLDIVSDGDGWVTAPKRRTEFEYGYERFPAWGDYVWKFFADYFDGRESGAIPADIHDAVRVLSVLDAAYESVDGDGWVEVEGV
ncbi:MAG: Gfo/Idh/MocA family protein [Halobacteriota archaeon]|uniref:Gfo/Idh/MocA family protein n=1 Tax=Natronomonas sp. TaxID=2184060 RepID=UPI0039761C47